MCGGSFGITDAETDSSGVVVLDFRVVDFLNSTFRLCLSRSVENLPLTSSLALLDSTLPKIRQNDGRTKSDKTSECKLALRRSRLLFFLVSWISFTKTSRSFHYVSTHFCFCNFGSTLLLRPTQIRLFQGLVQQKDTTQDILPF